MRCTAVCIDGWSPTHELFEELVGLLDDTARARIRAYKFRRDALASLVGRLLPLWEVCHRNRVKSLHSIKQISEPRGRPYLIDADTGAALDYDYNISHDGDVIVMVSTSAPPDSLKLGIDVMRLALPSGIPDIPEFTATVEDMLSSPEQNALKMATVSEKLGLLLRFWTTKEAVSKALGQGLSFPYVDIDSTAIHRRDTYVIQGRQCRSKEFTCLLGSRKYLIGVACLEPNATACALPSDVDVLPVEALLDLLVTREE